MANHLYMRGAVMMRDRTAAVQRLGERWIRELERSGGGGFVCSPAGLWLALTTVAAGARTETAEELRDLLGVAGQEAAAAVTEAARDWRRTGALSVATRVWGTLTIRQEYMDALPDIGFGPVGQGEIDAWVCERTGGLIERLPMELDDASLALVNVLALKALWETPFEVNRTREAPFTDAAGRTRPAATMHASVPLGDVWTVAGTHVVELRCRTGQGGAAPARIRFVLGRTGAGAAQVLPAAWASPEERAPLDAGQVTIAVPKLTLRANTQVDEQLPALGVRLATTMTRADFSGLSHLPACISDVVQETVLKIAEEGVEAAAVTVVALRMAVVRPARHIAFDRPFGIVVLDGSEDVPLFTAWQADAPTHEG